MASRRAGHKRCHVITKAIADVAKMGEGPDLGCGSRKGVKVQVLSSAPMQKTGLQRKRRRRRYAVPQKTRDNSILIPASIIALSLLAAISAIVFWLWPEPVLPPERDMFDKLSPPVA